MISNGIPKLGCGRPAQPASTVPLQDHQGNPIEGFIVIGLVVGVHIDERYIKNGLLDSAAMKPIARAATTIIRCPTKASPCGGRRASPRPSRWPRSTPDRA